MFFTVLRHLCTPSGCTKMNGKTFTWIKSDTGFKGSPEDLESLNFVLPVALPQPSILVMASPTESVKQARSNKISHNRTILRNDSYSHICL